LAIKNVQYRETGNKTKKKNKKQNTHNTICVGHQGTQSNTNNVNKTCSLLQTTGGKEEPIIVFSEILEDITTRNSERKDT